MHYLDLLIACAATAAVMFAVGWKAREAVLQYRIRQSPMFQMILAARQGLESQAASSKPGPVQVSMCRTDWDQELKKLK